MTRLILFILLFFYSVYSYSVTVPHKQFIRYTYDVNPMDFLTVEPRLLEVMATVAEFCKRNNITLMITSMRRTTKRNMEVGATSMTHVEGRAFDFSIRPVWGWTEEKLKQLENLVEKKHGIYGVYGAEKRQKVLLIHKVKGGVRHGHVQVVRDLNFTETIKTIWKME